MQLSKTGAGFIQHPEKPKNKDLTFFRNLKGIFPKIVEKEGVTGLYRGVTSPVVGTAPI